MTQKVVTQKSRALTIAVVIALVVGVLFLRRYFSLIVAAIIVAFLFNPVYEWLNKKFKSQSAAAATTLVITIIVIIAPLLIVLLVTLAQGRAMADDLTNFISNQQFVDSPQDAIDRLNSFLFDVTGRDFNITEDQIVTQLSSYASNVASFLLSTITSWVGSIGSIVTNVILYMYVFTAVLVHKSKLIRIAKQLNPLGDNIDDLYLKRAGAMTKGMVRGQFIIAIIQGVTSALILAIAGLPYFAFFALILTFMSVIPLGAGIVTLPIGVVMILLGNFWQGALIILGHLLLITNIDNFLKPILVPKSVKLQPALTLLSVFAGIAAFGFLGIIIGPVLMILIITTIEVYLRTNQSTPTSVS